FAPALRVLDISPLQPAKDDPFFLTIQHSTPEQLKRQFSQVEQKLRTVLSRLVILQRTPEEHSSRPQVQMSLYK
ncbi:MAG: hypothetical protein KDD73_15375, partial [Anaerolineales bacterium]|nr:hypothetical protein [Anaerolineales bacterium]